MVSSMAKRRSTTWIELAALPARFGRWLTLLAALGCLSCSGNSTLNPVQGRVFYKDQPLSGAVVTFHPEGGDDVKVIRPVGLTGEDGTFTLTTGDREGAPAGKYVVTVIRSEVVKKKSISTEQPDTRDQLGGAYADRAKSTLKVEIKDGPNKLDPFYLR